MNYTPASVEKTIEILKKFHNENSISMDIASKLTSALLMAQAVDNLEDTMDGGLANLND